MLSGMLSAVVLSLTVMATSPEESLVRMESVRYRGWTNTIALRNRFAELIYAPDVGRIVSYRRVGGENVLWLAEEAPDFGGWRNVGGDKVWIAPQARWGWPPDRNLDGSAHAVTPIPNGLRTESPVSVDGKFRIVREIVLEPESTRVRFRNTIVNVGKTAEDIAPWQITQVKWPLYAALPITRLAAFPNGFQNYDEKMVVPFKRVGDELHFELDPNRAYKIGGRSDLGYVAARVGDTRIELRMALRRGAKYPDTGRPQQIYFAPNPYPYVELEQADGVQTVRPGQSITQLTEWELSSTDPLLRPGGSRSAVQPQRRGPESRERGSTWRRAFPRLGAGPRP